jgi:hypothetical protein
VLGQGKNKGSLVPLKNEEIQYLREDDPINTIIKIDAADDFSAALTRKLDLFSF